jgi:hypothetical protein
MKTRAHCLKFDQTTVFQSMMFRRYRKMTSRGRARAVVDFHRFIEYPEIVLRMPHGYRRRTGAARFRSRKTTRPALPVYQNETRGDSPVGQISY